MIKDILSIRGEKVVHFQTGDCLALLNWPIIDPDTGVIEAFWVKPMDLDIKDAIILVSDIVAFKKKIYIQSERKICNPVDIIKIKAILDDGRQFLFSPVQNEKGRRYGLVYNISFSTETFVLRQLFIRKMALGFFPFNKCIFPYERVLKVLPRAVIVDDDTTKKEKAMEGPAELA